MTVLELVIIIIIILIFLSYFQKKAEKMVSEIDWLRMERGLNARSTDVIYKLNEMEKSNSNNIKVFQ